MSNNLWVIFSKNSFQNILRKKSSDGFARFVCWKRFHGLFFFLQWFGFALIRTVCFPSFTLQPSEISTVYSLRYIFCLFFRREKFSNGMMKILFLHWFLHSFLLRRFGWIKNWRSLIENNLWLWANEIFETLWFDIDKSFNRNWTWM